ncbi:MAG: nitrogenase cofactor biosynthesis protein NifB [archaeon]|nr:nitrogenase cofactor biosynthesis protein NifB [archaeon]
MTDETALQDALSTHPCFNPEAHSKYARMHIPVAPKCNIQCNYCNRRYDCSNESRPGVTSEVLTPEQAADKIGFVLEKIPNLKVIGIAGPGDPLANEETFRSLELIRERFPDLTPCISTNGLALPECAERLHSLGVRFITVTINANDAETGSRVYGSVLWNGRRYTGTEGARILLENQLKGIEMCSKMGMIVKTNIVMIPGINVDTIPDLVKRVRSLGAYIVNILPLIPVPGTVFENLQGPTPAERKALMDLCSSDARMMRHCRQCRADAIGLLGEDRSSEFTGCGYGHADGRGPSDEVPNMVRINVNRTLTVAVASDGGLEVDSGFGNTGCFRIFNVEEQGNVHLRDVPTVIGDDTLVGRTHRDRIEHIVDTLDDCDVIIVREIGDMPRRIIESRGKRVILCSGGMEDALALIR